MIKVPVQETYVLEQIEQTASYKKADVKPISNEKQIYNLQISAFLIHDIHSQEKKNMMNVEWLVFCQWKLPRKD